MGIIGDLIYLNIGELVDLAGMITIWYWLGKDIKWYWKVALTAVFLVLMMVFLAVGIYITFVLEVLIAAGELGMSIAPP